MKRNPKSPGKSAPAASSRSTPPGGPTLADGLTRRAFLRATGMAAAVALFPVELSVAGERPASRLFPTGLPERKFVEFSAQGYSVPVTGVIYSGENPPVSGVPLGGMDTGCLDLEASGLLGFCTIFNSLVPRRGPLNVPFLGLAVGADVWVLARPEKATDHKSCTPGVWGHRMPPHEVGPRGYELKEVRLPQRISYWGHYPMADLEFTLDGPISVGLRAFAPFLPGDVTTSLLPGAVFEVHLRNDSDRAQNGTVAFSFPGPSAVEAPNAEFARREVQGDFSGVEVSSLGAAYALGVIGSETARMGGELGIDGPAWASIARVLPSATAKAPGACVAVDFSLATNQTRTIRFVLTWFAPEWNAWGGNRLAETAKSAFPHWPTKPQRFT